MLKCNDFNHVSAKYPFEVTCAKCSGKHDVTVCKSIEFKCINCKKAADSLKIGIDTSHPAWSSCLSSLNFCVSFFSNMYRLYNINVIVIVHFLD